MYESLPPAMTAFSGVTLRGTAYVTSVLNAYNEGAGTQVVAFPESSVDLPGGGYISIADGTLTSGAYALRLTGSDKLDPEVTYERVTDAVPSMALDERR